MLGSKETGPYQLVENNKNREPHGSLIENDGSDCENIVRQIIRAFYTLRLFLWRIQLKFHVGRLQLFYHGCCESIRKISYIFIFFKNIPTNFIVCQMLLTITLMLGIIGFNLVNLRFRNILNFRNYTGTYPNEFFGVSTLISYCRRYLWQSHRSVGQSKPWTVTYERERGITINAYIIPPCLSFVVKWPMPRGRNIFFIVSVWTQA